MDIEEGGLANFTESPAEDASLVRPLHGEKIAFSLIVVGVVKSL
jgi:hypothetical protein